MYMKKKNNNGSFFSTICLFSIIYIIGSSIINCETGNKDYSSNSNYADVLTSDIDPSIIKRLEKEFSIEVDSDHEDELYMLNSLYENNNLSQEEKNTFSGYYSVICDLQNMDRNSAYNALNNVTVNKVERGEGVTENTLGDYDYRTRNINIYIKNDVENRVLLHEGIHCLFNNATTAGLPRGFTEGMTELLTNEYFSSDPFYEESTYPYEVSYVKMLCELIGTDIVIDSYLSGDYSLIYREMDKYNKSDFSSYKVLDIYEDSYNNCDALVNSKYSNEDRWKAYNIIEDIYNNRDSGIKENNAFNYYHELSAASFEENTAEFYAEYVMYYGVLEKAYISTDLMNQFNSNNYVKLYERHRLTK